MLYYSILNYIILIHITLYSIIWYYITLHDIIYKGSKRWVTWEVFLGQRGKTSVNNMFSSVSLTPNRTELFDSGTGRNRTRKRTEPNRTEPLRVRKTQAEPRRTGKLHLKLNKWVRVQLKSHWCVVIVWYVGCWNDSKTRTWSAAIVIHIYIYIYIIYLDRYRFVQKKK